MWNPFKAPLQLPAPSERRNRCGRGRRRCAGAALLLATSALAGGLPGVHAQQSAPAAAASAHPAIAAPPAGLKLDPFYQKYVDAGGIPVVSSGKVADEALLTARDLVLRMLAKRADVRAALQRSGVRVAVMAASEVTTDIPEHSDVYRAFPGTDWNKRARGLGATVARPACSAGEENLLRRPDDRYRGESILIHEFAHTVLTMGVQSVDPKFRPRLEAAYRAAKDAGLWARTYAATNPDEYWAEGVQSWFDANREATPANGIHNEVDTREELVRYDPALAALITEVFPDDWRWSRK